MTLDFQEVSGGHRFEGFTEIKKKKKARTSASSAYRQLCVASRTVDLSVRKPHLLRSKRDDSIYVIEDMFIHMLFQKLALLFLLIGMELTAKTFHSFGSAPYMTDLLKRRVTPKAIELAVALRISSGPLVLVVSSASSSSSTCGYIVL